MSWPWGIAHEPLLERLETCKTLAALADVLKSWDKPRPQGSLLLDVLQTMVEVDSCPTSSFFYGEETPLHRAMGKHPLNLLCLRFILHRLIELRSEADCFRCLFTALQTQQNEDVIQYLESRCQRSHADRLMQYYHLPGVYHFLQQRGYGVDYHVLDHPQCSLDMVDWMHERGEIPHELLQYDQTCRMNDDVVIRLFELGYPYQGFLRQVVDFSRLDLVQTLLSRFQFEARDLQHALNTACEKRFNGMAQLLVSRVEEDFLPTITLASMAARCDDRLLWKALDGKCRIPQYALQTALRIAIQSDCHEFIRMLLMETDVDVQPEDVCRFVKRLEKQGQMPDLLFQLNQRALPMEESESSDSD